MGMWQFGFTKVKRTNKLLLYVDFFLDKFDLCHSPDGVDNDKYTRCTDIFMSTRQA